MRVGIFYSGSAPEAGGGHTYEQDLLSSFLSVAQESHHEFILLSKTDMTGVLGKYPHTCLPNRVIRGKPLARIFLQYFFDGLFFTKLALKVSRLNKVIKDERIDMVVFLSPAPEAVECPYVVPVWDLQHRLQPWFPEVSNNGIWAGREKYTREMLGRATYIITGTSEGRDEISFFYTIPKDRVRILPLPTPEYCLGNVQKKTPEDLRKFGIPGNYLLYPAQFWSHKNHVMAIHALEILFKEYKLPVSLVFVGSDAGNLSYVKKTALNHELSEFIHFLGFVSREDLIGLYQNASALVFPSFFGPDNIPPLEAFALGCPVVAADVPGAKEQLGDAALLVDPRIPAELARAVDRIINSPSLRTTLVEKGCARAHGWTGKEYVRGVFSLLDEFEAIRACWE
jgi:glycosyltransferase involved in cell wall biosynthesis